MKKPALVRYLPLFGSPGWMPVRDAERMLAREDDLYLRMIEAGMKPGSAPRIEHRTETTTHRTVRRRAR